MRAGTLVPATPRPSGRVRTEHQRSLNEGRNFSSGNTATVAQITAEVEAPLNEGRNFSSGNTRRKGQLVDPRMARSMRAGTLVPATPGERVNSWTLECRAQ